MDEKKIHIYFVPGLAASSRIFEYLKFPEDRFELHFLEWLLPISEKEKIEDYSKRMAALVTAENPVLVGVSFGGIIVQEMSKHLNVKKIILISSLKNKHELPKRLKFIQTTKAYKLIPTSLLLNIENLAKFSFGPSEIPRWKRQQFPEVSYEEYEYLKSALPKADELGYQLFVGPEKIKYEANTVSSVKVKPVSYEFIDFRKSPLSNKEFQSMIDSVGSELLINKRSTTYRSLTENQKSIACSMRFRSPDRTLGENEVNAAFEKIVEKMCHNPAKIFKIEKRGFIKVGYYADLVIVNAGLPWSVKKENILAKCGWSPFEGYTFKSRITHTFVNGQLVYNAFKVKNIRAGKRLLFNR